MEWWQTVLLTLVTASVPITLGWVLSRKGANKKLVLDEKATDVSVFDSQTKAYQDLLDRANRTITDLEKYKTEREDLISNVKTLTDEVDELKRADKDKSDALDETNGKLDRLRTLFASYIDRVGTVPLTTAELAIFEDTMPTKTFRRRTKERN